MIIEVKDSKHPGVQEWYILHADLISWNNRIEWEYKLGEYIGESR